MLRLVVVVVEYLSALVVLASHLPGLRLCLRLPSLVDGFALGGAGEHVRMQSQT